MDIDRLQVLVWFFTPILALMLMVALMGARGGVWFFVPISLTALAIGIFYLLLLWVRAHENRH